MWGMIEGVTQKVVTYHKEEATSHVMIDSSDREKICHYLQIFTNPLNAYNHPTNDALMNIEIGQINLWNICKCS